MKPLHYLTAALLTLGVIIALVPANAVRPSKVNNDLLLKEIKQGAYYINAETVAQMIINQDPLLRLVDVRDESEFTDYNLPKSVNIPLSKITDEYYTNFLGEGVNTIVLYSNGNVEAVQAWMFCRMQGYNNIYIMQGGLNYWFDAIMQPKQPAVSAADDEQAKYAFRKAAGRALGADSSAAGTPAPQAVQKIPAITPAPGKGKKRASGGCG